MADKLPFDEPLRRAIDANVRYYEALGKVTQDYWKAIFGILRELPVRFGTGGGAAAPGTPPVANPTAPTGAASLVLEAPAGGEASGVFLVENRLARVVSTAVVTSAFADPSGRALQPVIRVSPGVVTLPPGGRTLVQIVAAIGDDLAPDTPYRGEVSVPGLSEQGIPVLVRRLPSAAKPAAAVTPAADATKGTAAPPPRSPQSTRATAKKRTDAKKPSASSKRTTSKAPRRRPAKRDGG
jgi:hypothetical protein